MPDLTKQIVVRISTELHDALRADAEANGRMLAQSVRFHLRAALSATGGESDV